MSISLEEDPTKVVDAMRWVGRRASRPEERQLRVHPCTILLHPVLDSGSVRDPDAGSRHGSRHSRHGSSDWIPRHWIPAFGFGVGSRRWIPELPLRSLCVIRLLQEAGVPRSQRYEALRETALKELNEELFAKDLVIAQSRRQAQTGCCVIAAWLLCDCYVIAA
jgi:hypothetical protein